MRNVDARAVQQALIEAVHMRHDNRTGAGLSQRRRFWG
jgi:hypothetical protein